MNGEYLGVYSHIESIRKRFLKDHFASSKGNLYEGQLADFIETEINKFEKKTNKKQNDRSDLFRVADALTGDPSDLMSELDKIVDLNAFYKNWAMESLIVYWDSYTGNDNNFLIYNDPGNNKFYFLPWGTDDSMAPSSGKASDLKNPRSVQANGLIPYHLYQLEEGRQRYREQLTEILETVWDEEALFQEIATLQAKIRPHIHFPSHLFDKAVDDIKTFIRDRRQVLEKELVGPIPTWKADAKAYKRRDRQKQRVTSDFPRLQLEFNGPLTTDPKLVAKLTSGKFEWNDFPRTGSADLNIDLYDNSRKIAETRIIAYPNRSGFRADFPSLLVRWRYEGSDDTYGILLFIDPGKYQTQNPIEVDGYSVFPIMLEKHGDGPWSRSAWLRGTLALDEAGTGTGQFASGVLDVEILTQKRTHTPQ